jgi:enoyl-CoA hydratase/carnithine racemase
MTADEGERWGFHNRVVEGEALMETALELARSLARGPTFAHGITKNQLNVEWDMSLDAAIESEAQAQAICMQTNDFRRAYEAFAAKREPVFEGN